MKTIASKLKRFFVASVAVVALAVVFGGILRVKADASIYSLTGGSVEVDGTSDKTVAIPLVASEAGTWQALEGKWSLNETGATSWLTLSDLTAAGTSGVFSENSPETGNIVWFDTAGFALSAGSPIWTATYTVDKDTPTGEYTVQFDVVAIDYENGEGMVSDEAFTLNATVAVTNNTPKSAQTVAFTGGVTGTTVEKTYGDADFVYTATTNGNGAISYSSSDSSVASVNAKTGEVKILRAGKNIDNGIATVTVTATAAETDEYAEASATYALRVSRKPVTVTSIEMNEKVYDGRTDFFVVKSVTLSDETLVQDRDYTTMETFFNGEAPNVGFHKDGVAVKVRLDEYYWDKYTLRSTFVNADVTIVPLELTGSNTTVEWSGSDFTYTGAEIKPTASVKVDLDGDGTKETTLSAGTDYEIVYADNVNAGTGTATINGKGNYSGKLDAFGFTINQAVSAEPEEMSVIWIADAGSTVANLGGERTTGFTWDDEVAVVTAGWADYKATYTHNGDTRNYTTIALEVPVYGLSGKAYGFVVGGGMEYQLDEGGEALFRVDANFDLFQNGGMVFVDGVWVDPTHYVASSGSTKIVFTSDYMGSLATGAHTLAVLFNDGGMASTLFSVEGKSGDESADDSSQSGVAKVSVGNTGQYTEEDGGALAATGALIAVAFVVGISYCVIMRRKKA